MITKNRVIAERLLREFIRGSFGIISEGFMPGDEEIAAEEAKKLVEVKISHLQEADAFISINATALNTILDDLEGPSIDNSLTELMNILIEAMNLDNLYKSNGNTDPNFATTFTCVAIADGNPHYIPYLTGRLFDWVGSRITSNTSLIREAGGESAAKLAEEVNRIVEMVIPLIFRKNTAIAKNISDNPSLFDMNAKGDYSIPARDMQGVLSPGMPSRKARLSFKEALNSSIEKNITIKIDQNVTVSLEEAPAKIQELDTIAKRLRTLYDDLITRKADLVAEQNKFDLVSDAYDELSEQINNVAESIDDISRRFTQIENQIEKIKEFNTQARAAIVAKINDEQYIIGQIKNFAISELKGAERVAAQYPKISKVGDAATDASKTKIGKYAIGALLTAGLGTAVYTGYEMTPVQIKRVNAVYSASQNSAIDIIVELFNDNDYPGSGYYEFATKLKSYKAVVTSAGK